MADFDKKTAVDVLKCWVALCKYEGVPPYDTLSNICLGDGYTWAWIKRTFDDDMIEFCNDMIHQKYEKRAGGFLNRIKDSFDDWEV